MKQTKLKILSIASHYAGAFLLLMLLYASPCLSQTGGKTITGSVIDIDGAPVVGASITDVTRKTGTTTDLEGRFSLNVYSGDILTVSCIGYLPQKITVGNQNVLLFTLVEDEKQLSEVVVVGYGTQKKLSVTGAVSQIRGEELLKAPTANVTNLLAGRIAGVTALQQSGQPGSDASSILVRGAGAKSVVDGVVRDLSEIDPNDIATISVLKDASAAAIYGLDASAVIIVTTKRGQAAPSKINFTASYGLSTNTEMLQLLDGPQYAYWYNKARVMDGNDPVFSEEHVRKMLAGEGGWGNTNWYEETFGTGTNSEYNINASGGTEKIKYFVSASYFDQTGNVENFTYNRMNLRSNIDAKITNNLALTFDLAGRIENRRRSTWSTDPSVGSNIAQQAVRALPFVPTQWEGLPVATPTASSFVSPLASASDAGGYRTDKSNIMQTTVALNYSVPFIEGLSAKFAVSYDYTDGMSKQMTIPYDVYKVRYPSDPSGDISYYRDYFPSKGDAALTEGATRSISLTTNTSLRYERNWNDLHHLNALLLMETYQTDYNGLSAQGFGFTFLELDELSRATLADRNGISGSSSHTRQAGYLGRINYDYAGKYLLELTARYDGSYRFGGKNINGKRWVLTPATSVGWRLSEEKWFKDALPCFNNFKLRGGIGLTGLTSGLPAYFYLNTFSSVANAVVIGGVSETGLNTSALANVNLTWSKSLQYNAGFDATLWNGLLGVEFDVFYKYIYDIPAYVASSTADSWGGYVYGYENVNKKDHKGFEVALTHTKKVGDFTYRIGLNGTYAKRRWLKYNDAENTPDYLKLTGKEEGALEGFIALGLFRDREEINNSAVMDIYSRDKLQPGDIKYLDRNGDGKITYDQDRGWVGKSAYPKFTGGLDFYAEWKGIDISFLWQGAADRTIALTGVYSGVGMDNSLFTKSFYHTSNTPLYLVENSWTEDNPNAIFPRLTITPSTTNNAYSSTFWYRNGDYLRLKSAQIGYNFNPKLLRKTGINALRLYVEGQNLLTFSELTKYNIDPEQPGVSNGYYPQQRVFAGGIKLTF
ncbi:MAG: TonB-dependent receptor [Dysgonamonadaceae bacterium]|jgi:TonB-linked SusC/RagA family outer membrane protein|nr:TonB-dependent receptor [Dysgonamonadaceae bacterium]